MQHNKDYKTLPKLCLFLAVTSFVQLNLLGPMQTLRVTDIIGGQTYLQPI